MSAPQKEGRAEGRGLACVAAAAILGCSLAASAARAAPESAGGSPTLEAAEKKIRALADASGPADAEAIRPLIGTLSAYLAAHKSSGRALLLRGTAYRLLRENQKAKSDLEQAARQDPDLALAHYNLGVVFEAQGTYDAAREAYERAVAKDAGIAAAQYNLGRLYERSGKFAQAQSAYFAATVAETPPPPRALVALGNARLRTGDPRGALSLYDEAAKSWPNSGALQYNRAVALEKLELYEEALTLYRGVVAASSRHAPARLGWARCALRLSRWDQAEEALSPLTQGPGADAESAARKLLDAARRAHKADIDRFSKEERIRVYSLEGPPQGPPPPDGEMPGLPAAPPAEAAAK